MRGDVAHLAEDLEDVGGELSDVHLEDVLEGREQQPLKLGALVGVILAGVLHQPRHRLKQVVVVRRVARVLCHLLSMQSKQ